MKWQPIKTLSRHDQREIDIWSPHYGRHTDCTPADGGWIDGKGDWVPESWATHWMRWEPPAPGERMEAAE